MTPYKQHLAMEMWNRDVPPGTTVEYTPVLGGSEVRLTRTRSEAWRLGCGEPVVLVEGVAGGVFLRALKVVHSGGRSEPLLVGDMDARRPQAG